MTPPWLGLALYAEGPTDHRFLGGLLPRAVTQLLTTAGYTVAVGETQRLPVDGSFSTRADRIAAGADRLQDGFHRSCRFATACVAQRGTVCRVRGALPGADGRQGR